MGIKGQNWAIDWNVAMTSTLDQKNKWIYTDSEDDWILLYGCKEC